MDPDIYRRSTNTGLQQGNSAVRTLNIEEVQAEISKINEEGAKNNRTRKTLQGNTQTRRKIADILDRLVDLDRYPSRGLKEMFPRLLPDPAPNKCWNLSSNMPLQWSSRLASGPIHSCPPGPATTGLAMGQDLATESTNPLSIVNYSSSNHARGATSRKTLYGGYRNVGNDTIVKIQKPSVASNSPPILLNYKAAIFQPSKQLINHPRQISLETKRFALQEGLCLSINNYLGDIDRYVIENANTPPHMNCAVFIKRTPPQATDADILATVTEGKVFLYFKKPPSGPHTTCAATIAFMGRSSAEQYIRKSQTSNGIVIRGLRTPVVWSFNPIGPVEFEERAQRTSLMRTILRTFFIFI